MAVALADFRVERWLVEGRLIGWFLVEELMVVESLVEGWPTGGSHVEERSVEGWIVEGWLVEG